MPEEPPVFGQIDGRIEEEDKFSDNEKKELKEFFREYYAEVSFKTGDIRLDQFSSENFRTIDENQVDFGRSDTVLYGQNSKGKTSLVKAILYNIAGLPENPTSFDMTRLIKTDKSILNTVGYWTIDDSPYTLERSLRQSGQGSSLSGNQEPYLSKDYTTEATISGKFTDPSDVLEKFGFQDLKQRGHDPYEVLSLFFLMSEDFTRFLGEKHSELMDLLFGVNITTVMSAVNNKIGELELSEVENKSAQEFRHFEAKQEQLGSELEDEIQRRQTILDDLKEKQDQLNTLEEVLSGENELDRLRSRKNELEGRRADYKIEKREVIEELASVRRTIERYEDTELVDDMTGIADELRNFMTIPNRCPVCTNEVDTDQREDLVNDGACPLCQKEMPSDRYRTELEYEQPEEASDVNGTHNEQDLESLHESERELSGEKTRLETRIKSIEEELKEITDDISQNDLSDLADERDELQREVRSLRDEAVELGVKTDSLEEQFERIKYEKKANAHLKDIAKQKDDRRQTFRRFKSIVEKARRKQREKIKQQIAEEMFNLFDYFTRGTLEEAHDVAFKSGGSYHFEIRTSTRDLDSSVADESTAEINLHALLFHTAVLKLLSKSINSPPLRLFVIDSPFANEVDEQNEKDIIDFLVSLPQILPEYQVVLASAETDSFEPEQYAENYKLVRFD